MELRSQVEFSWAPRHTIPTRSGGIPSILFVGTWIVASRQRHWICSQLEIFLGVVEMCYGRFWCRGFWAKLPKVTVFGVCGESAILGRTRGAILSFWVLPRFQMSRIIISQNFHQEEICRACWIVPNYYFTELRLMNRFVALVFHRPSGYAHEMADNIATLKLVNVFTDFSLYRIVNFAILSTESRIISSQFVYRNTFNHIHLIQEMSNDPTDCLHSSAMMCIISYPWISY